MPVFVFLFPGAACLPLSSRAGLWCASPSVFKDSETGPIVLCCSSLPLKWYMTLRLKSCLSALIEGVYIHEGCKHLAMVSLSSIFSRLCLWFSACAFRPAGRLLSKSCTWMHHSCSDCSTCLCEGSALTLILIWICWSTAKQWPCSHWGSQSGYLVGFGPYLNISRQFFRLDFN